MEYNYSIKEGELLLNNSKRFKFIVWFMFLFRIVKLSFLLFSFGITAYLTYLIFEECITDATLTNCIPLGSIFATFGSAVISVVSLYCNKQIGFSKRIFLHYMNRYQFCPHGKDGHFSKDIAGKKLLHFCIIIIC